MKFEVLAVVTNWLSPLQQTEKTERRERTQGRYYKNNRNAILKQQAEYRLRKRASNEQGHSGS
jgi:DNA-binding transcriptional ArsR family regulator